MAFYIRYLDVPAGTLQVLNVHPKPTGVEYPDVRDFNAIDTQDGNVVLQRPIRDRRRRRWFWVGFRSYMVVWENMWNTIVPLEAKARAEAGFTDVTVEIWEDESSGEGGFNLTTDGQPPSYTSPTVNNLKWTKVKFIQVSRQSRKQGGPVAYDPAFIEFVIKDPTYERF